MSDFFIKKIDNNPKNQLEKIEKPKNKIIPENLKKNISNNILDEKGEDDKSNICNRHNSK